MTYLRNGRAFPGFNCQRTTWFWSNILLAMIYFSRWCQEVLLALVAQFRKTFTTKDTKAHEGKAVRFDGAKPRHHTTFGIALRGCGESVSRLSIPQRLEAAIDSAAVTARVELVPFQTLRESEFFSELSVLLCRIAIQFAPSNRVHRKSIQRRQYFWRRALLWCAPCSDEQ